MINWYTTHMKKTIWIVLILMMIGFALYILWRPDAPLVPVSTTATSTSSTVITYTNQQLGFSIEHPADFVVNDRYQYTALGPNKEISGVSFSIPSSQAEGTNLSQDSYVSVEVLNKTSCTTRDFMEYPSATSTVTDSGVTYMVASTTDVGLGNYYEDTVYVLPNCHAIRYLIHSANIMNYDPGTVREFNRAVLLSEFDRIRKSYRSFSQQ